MDEGLAHFIKACPGETITKDDLFDYICGLLYSKEYRERYADKAHYHIISYHARSPLLSA